MLVLRVPHSAKYLGRKHAKVKRQELNSVCEILVHEFFRVACASSCTSPKPRQAAEVVCSVQQGRSGSFLRQKHISAARSSWALS